MQQSFPLLGQCVDDWPLMSLFQFKIEDMRKNAARGRTTTLARQLNVDAGPVLPINCMVNSPAASTNAVTDGVVLLSLSASATQVVGISQNDTTSEAPETYSTTENTFIEPHSTATVDSEPPVHPRAIGGAFGAASTSTPTSRSR